MYYPVMIDIADKKVTVFGAGQVAYRKVKSLLECGAKVSVVSKEFIDSFHQLTQEFSKLELIEDEYKDDYVEGNYLIVAATGDAEVNLKIYNRAKNDNTLCNMVDNGENADYIVPSVVRRGDLILSVSTSGKSPSLSKKIKKELEERYSEEWEEYVNLLGEIREMVISRVDDPKEKKRILNTLVDLSQEELKAIKRSYL